ncbi:MAG: SH3 domain-containing protein [Sedimentitalea sp.]|nr:SH3 domain-containing protein [Sedimentitalea sp.]
MRRAMISALAAVVLGVFPGIQPAQAGMGGYYEVHGVEGDDMLKMRAGPGTGYRVVLGLPNGTVLRVHDCDQTGGTRWCKVSLKQARGLKGYVSWAYLREN